MKKEKKKLLKKVIVSIVVLSFVLTAVGSVLAFSSTNNLISCLEREGVVIYGTKWCALCARLIESFGGYEKVKPIFVDCDEDGEKCKENMFGRGVPEVQIKGEYYSGTMSPDDIAGAAGCIKEENLSQKEDVSGLTIRSQTNKSEYREGEEVVIEVEAQGEGVLNFNTGCQVTYKIGNFDLERERACTMALTQATLPASWMMIHDLEKNPLPPGEHQVKAGVIGYGEKDGTIIKIIEERKEEKPSPEKSLESVISFWRRVLERIMLRRI